MEKSCWQEPSQTYSRQTGDRHTTLGDKMTRDKTIWRIITSVVIALVGSSGSDFSHFTWWSIGWLGIYGMLEEIDLGIRYFWFYTTVQVIVVMGVIVMGFSDCTVFTDTFENTGAALYISGNFAMHYLPILIVIYMSKKEYIFVDVEDAIRQVMCAYGIFLIWHYFRDATEVYGCSLPNSIGIIGMALLTFTVSIAIISINDIKDEYF